MTAQMENSSPPHKEEGEEAVVSSNEEKPNPESQEEEKIENLSPSKVAEKTSSNEEKPNQESQEEKKIENPSPSKVPEKTSFLSDLKDSEKKSLIDLKSKIQASIAENNFFPKEEEEIEEISLWGVPLFPIKNPDAAAADVILLKFLRGREFKADEALKMIRNTLRWRKDSKIDSVLEETELGEGFGAASYMEGVDREGQPVCYNVPAALQKGEVFREAFGSREGRERFLRWRVKVMEMGIRKLDLGRPNGVSRILQVTDLKDAVGPSKKEVRDTMKQALQVLQDNYPEFVATNIFINVPFWYYAFYALLSPFMTQRTKSKFVISRSANVTETLLKYIPAESIPLRYGGFKREDDAEFSVEHDPVSEIVVKASSRETIEIAAPEDATTLIWDLSVLGWDVNYKEEFVPTDEGSYTVLVQKLKKIGSSQEEPIRNSFRNNEPGKIILTVENCTSKKKKVLFRYKTKST